MFCARSKAAIKGFDFGISSLDKIPKFRRDGLVDGGGGGTGRSVSVMRDPGRTPTQVRTFSPLGPGSETVLFRGREEGGSCCPSIDISHGMILFVPVKITLYMCQRGSGKETVAGHLTRKQQAVSTFVNNVLYHPRVEVSLPLYTIIPLRARSLCNY